MSREGDTTLRNFSRRFGGDMSRGGRYHVKELLGRFGGEMSRGGDTTLRNFWLRTRNLIPNCFCMQIYHGGSLESYGQGWTGGGDLSWISDDLGARCQPIMVWAGRISDPMEEASKSVDHAGVVGWISDDLGATCQGREMPRSGTFGTIWGRDVKGGDTTLRNFWLRAQSLIPNCFCMQMYHGGRLESYGQGWTGAGDLSWISDDLGARCKLIMAWAGRISDPMEEASKSVDHAGVVGWISDDLGATCQGREIPR